MVIIMVDITTTSLIMTPDKSIQMYGASIGWGKRLRWPDDYFTLSAELSYQRFILKDWSYLYIKLNNGEYMSTGKLQQLEFESNSGT